MAPWTQATGAQATGASYQRQWTSQPGKLDYVAESGNYATMAKSDHWIAKELATAAWAADSPSTFALGPGLPSKALPIKDPKTGETITASQTAARQAKPFLGTATPKAASAEQWEALAKFLASRTEKRRWCPDNSTLSALNVEAPFQKVAVQKATLESMAACTELQLGSSGKTATAKVLALPLEQRSGMRVPRPLVSVMETEPVVELGAECQKRAGATGESSTPGRRPRESTGATSTPSVSPPASGANSEATSSPALSRSPSAVDVRSCLLSFRATVAGQPAPSEIQGFYADAEVIPQETSLEATDGGALDRSGLMAFRFTVAEESVPKELQGFLAARLAASEESGESCRSSPSPYSQTADRCYSSSTEGERNGNGRLFTASTPKSNIFTSSTPKSSISAGSLPTPSPKAYRPGSGRTLSRSEDLTKTTRSALNKICPENVATIAEQIGGIQVENAAELEVIMSLVFKKALAEPTYCHTYADLVFMLHSNFKEFVGSDGKTINMKTLKSTLLNICQREFESLPTSFDPSAEDLANLDSEEVEHKRMVNKKRVLANMKFIGQLFLRKLVSAVVITSIIKELTLCNNAEQVPEEHVIECTVELLMNIGYTLESLSVGSDFLNQVCGRLVDLKKKYCKRVGFQIQALIETRQANWTTKTFGGVAKTKEAIRQEQQRDLASPQQAETGQRVVAGQRPEYIKVAPRASQD